MKRISIFLIGLFLFTSFVSKADEGMWLPILINQNMATMTEKGLQLSADDIYNINSSSLKDAIIALDGGNCTGEIISGEGLVLTNHHCGYGEIQAHSSKEHNYLADGFWAMSKKEELPNPGKTASFLIRVEEITKQILSQIPETATQAERNKLVDSIASTIADEATKDSHYKADVESMFKGNAYYLFIYEVFQDVRLVGAPPETIGKYGADTDNWMWPRHTADFSLFRVYMGADGKPAPYAEDNVPIKPKHFLPISIDGIEKNDFAMIMGYPGHTQRYMTSYELKYTIEHINPNISKIRGVKQNAWKADMDKDVDVYIKYASKFARSSNYWKYAIAQNKALKRLDVYGQKQELENEFISWINEDDVRLKKYGSALSLIEDAVNTSSDTKTAQLYFRETLIQGAEAFLFARKANKLNSALIAVDNVDASVDKFKTFAKAFFKDYNAPTDKAATKVLIKLFIQDVPEKYYPEYIKTVIQGKYKGNVDKYVDDLFKKSIFVDEVKLNAFLEKPSAKALSKDPVFSASASIFSTYFMTFNMQEQANLNKQEGMRLLVSGLLEMKSDKVFYPDANSTMRLTYGSVGDYFPADAKHYDYFTTLKGVMEKEDPDVKEFNVPAKLKEIYKNKDYGSYGNEDGTMNVCFTTNNDITGGNSGSPVINSKGQLIGLAFDGNYEAMSGDIAFEQVMQKCINVDIRYVLLLIDKFAGAQNLIDELNIVKTMPTQVVKEEAVPVQ